MAALAVIDPELLCIFNNIALDEAIPSGTDKDDKQ